MMDVSVTKYTDAAMILLCKDANMMVKWLMKKLFIFKCQKKIATGFGRSNVSTLK